MSLHYSVRAPQMDDASAVVDLTNTYSVALGFQPVTSVERTQYNWQNSGIDLERDAWLIETEDRQLVAYAQHGISDPAHFFHWGCADPEHGHLWTDLISLCEARSRELAQIANVAEITITNQVNHRDASAAYALTNAGYQLQRVMWDMEINLNASVTPVILPEGLDLKLFTLDDAPALHQTYEAAFADHFGQTPTEYEHWAKQWLEGVLYDPEVWFLAMTGTEIAGFALCLSNIPGTSDIGWVALLGVHPKWRKKGLGMALLQESFYRLQQRGKTRIGLQVDSANTTNATELYERAGMSIMRQMDNYHKIVRVE